MTEIKIWHVPQIPMKAFEVTVTDLDTAVLICDTLAKYDIFQYENKIKPDYCNVNGIKILFPGETEWEGIDPDDEDDLQLARFRLGYRSSL